MAKGYTRSSHMSGNDPDCGSKLFRTPNPAGNISGGGPSHSTDYGKHGCGAQHMPRMSGEAYKYASNVKLPGNRGGDRVGSRKK